MPLDDFEEYLAGFRPLPPEPLPARRLRWLVPVVLAAALALVFWRIPSGAPDEIHLTLGRANALVTTGASWSASLDQAAFSSSLAQRGALEFLTQEELVR